jgi:hypothetical protein
LRYLAPGFLNKSDLFGLEIQKLGQKIQNSDGLGLKIAIFYFLALSPTSLKIVRAVSDGVKNCLALSPTVLKILSAVADSEVFGLFSNSPICTGLICVKIPATIFSCLGPFKVLYTVRLMK